MPQDDDQLDNEDRDDLDTDADGFDPKAVEAIKRERLARKQASREAKEAKSALDQAREALRAERFQRFKGQHTWLEESDLEGTELEQWEAKIERLAVIAGATQGSEGASSPTKPDAVSDDERKAIERLTDGAGGKGQPLADPDLKLSALEADKKFRAGDWSQGQYEKWMRQKYEPNRT